MSHIETISIPTVDHSVSRIAPSASDAALIDLCARWSAAHEGACAFGDLVNDMPPDHDQFAACMKTDGALSQTLDDIALQIARTRATTTAGLAAKARIVRYAAAGAAGEVNEDHNGGAIAIALAQSLLRDLEA